MMRKNAYVIAENFVRSRGLEKLLWLFERLNAGDSLSEIVAAKDKDGKPILWLTVGRLSQIVSAIMLRRYVLAPGAEDFVKWRIENDEWHTEQMRLDFEHFRAGNIAATAKEILEMYRSGGKSNAEGTEIQPGAQIDSAVA